MRPFVHPPRDAITLQGVLHALADPVRLDILRRLAGQPPTGISCTACAPADMAKSTLSYHFQVLREAGLVRSERRGTEVANTPRLDDLEARFPGLFDSIVRAADFCGSTAEDQAR